MSPHASQNPYIPDRLSFLPDAGLLVGRVAIGVVFIAHGWDKLDKGHGAVSAGFDKGGIPLPDLSAAFVTWVELAGGIAMILGLLVPLTGLLLAFTMAGAYWYVHRENGLFANEGGYEYVLVLAALALLLTFVGGGRFGLDAVFSRRVRGQRSRTGEVV
ncbi:DoxX family protein [Actinomadura fulvescens]|uniref:DoxX family protein n=1 Tax=Actinomadura fulvescens TaxID=46160 RepID=A0ABN3Q7T6_9ACTN